MQLNVDVFERNGCMLLVIESDDAFVEESRPDLSSCFVAMAPVLQISLLDEHNTDILRFTLDGAEIEMVRLQDQANARLQRCLSNVRICHRYLTL